MGVGEGLVWVGDRCDFVGVVEGVVGEFVCLW